MQKIILFLLMIFTLFLTACSTIEQPIEKTSKELVIYNWEDYIGETTIEDFEEKYGSLQK